MKRNLTTAKNRPRSKRGDTTKPLLGKLIKWTVLAIVALNITVIILYIASSIRKSPDDFLLSLVRMCLVLSLLMIISSIYGFLLNVFYSIRKRHISYLGGGAGYILIIVFGIILAIAAAFIIGAVEGNL